MACGRESALPTATACKQTRRQSRRARACAQACDCALVPASYQISTQDTPSSVYRVARLMARLNEAPVPTESVDACMFYCISTLLSTLLSSILTRPSKAPLRTTKPRTRKVGACDTIHLESLDLTSCLPGITRPNVCASVPSSARSRACSPKTSTFAKTSSTSRLNYPNLALTLTTLPSSRSNIN